MKATYRKPRQRRERHGGSASKPSKTLVLHRHRCPQAHLRCSEGRGGHRSGSEPVVLGGLGWEPMRWILWVRQVPGYHTGCGCVLGEAEDGVGGSGEGAIESGSLTESVRRGGRGGRRERERDEVFERWFVLNLTISSPCAGFLLGWDRPKGAVDGCITNGRERRWFLSERTRRDTNGGSETEVTVTSKLHAQEYRDTLLINIVERDVGLY